MIIIKNATISYRNKPLFADLNLTLEPGSWTALLGPSGVGKSSLLRFVAGLLDANAIQTGQILAQTDTVMTGQIAYMAQTDLLLPWLTIRDNVLLGLKLKRVTRTARLAMIQQAELLLAKTGITAAADLYPPQLSGGMRQRAALVRPLLQNKPIILMDEPFSALDAITRHALQNLAAELLRGKTVLFITHDPVEALRLAQTIYILQGQPATLSLSTVLDTPTPRATTDPNVLQWQVELMQQLTQAAESC